MVEFESDVKKIDGISTHLSGSEKNRDALTDWRIGTLNKILVIVAALGLLSVIFLLANTIERPTQLRTGLIFLVPYAIILALAFIKKIDWRIRGWGFLVIAYLIGILALSRGGLAGAGREYLIIIPILATILVGASAGIASAVLSLITMIAFGFFFDAGYLKNILIYQQNPVDLITWTQEIAYTAVLMGVGTILLILFNRYLVNMLGAERKAREDLNAAQARLEGYSETLEIQVNQRTSELEDAYRVVEQANQRMEQELTIAGKVQSSLMSIDLPRINGWQVSASLIPARQTSGDFYDIIPLGKDRYGILVADVVDKGVGAALFMTMCWTLMRTYAYQNPNRPDLVMQKVSHRLYVDSHSEQFVTLFYGVLDYRRGELSYSNAGHNPPYLVRAGKDHTVHALKSTGVPLGVFEKGTWRSETINFNAGDVMVLYTDGITEAEDPDNDLFGSERLVEAVEKNLGRNAQEVHDAVIQQLQDFVRGSSQTDDITLIILVCEMLTAELKEPTPYPVERVV